MRIQQTASTGAAPDTVWAVIADPQAIARAVGPQMIVTALGAENARGAGARYRLFLHAGATLAGGEIEIVEFRAPREFAWTAITGISHRFRLRLRPTPAGGTTVNLRFSYDAPGVLGTFADLVAYRGLQSVMRDGLHTLLATAAQTAPESKR